MKEMQKRVELEPDAMMNMRDEEVELLDDGIL